MSRTVYALLALSLAGAAYADGTMSSVKGAPPAVIHTSHLFVDANGDGLIQKSEVVPGSQLEKRFDTRDANKDGTLSKDEYYLP